MRTQSPRPRSPTGGRLRRQLHRQYPCWLDLNVRRPANFAEAGLVLSRQTRKIPWPAAQFRTKERGGLQRSPSRCLTTPPVGTTSRDRSDNLDDTALPTTQPVSTDYKAVRFCAKIFRKIRPYQLIGCVRRRTCGSIPCHQTAPRLHCVGKEILGDPHVPVVHRIPLFCRFDRRRRITAHRTNGQVGSCVCVDILRNTLVLDVDTPFKRGVLLHQRCLLLQILWTGSRFRNHFLHSGNQSRMVVQINTLHGFRIAWKYTG